MKPSNPSPDKHAPPLQVMLPTFIYMLPLRRNVMPCATPEHIPAIAEYKPTLAWPTDTGNAIPFRIPHHTPEKQTTGLSKSKEN